MIRIGTLIRGYRKGIVTFPPCPQGDGVHEPVCKIGDNWFYFGGMEAEESTPDEFMENVGLWDVCKEAFDALHDSNGLSGIESMDPDEYAYYEALLKEAGCM